MYIRYNVLNEQTCVAISVLSAVGVGEYVGAADVGYKVGDADVGY